jgi:ferritin-like metal-binding protein YciE
MDAMGFFSKDIKTMDDLFVHTLRDTFYAEKQIVVTPKGKSWRRCPR